VAAKSIKIKWQNQDNAGSVYSKSGSQTHQHEGYIIIIIIIIIVALQPFVGPWPLFEFLDPRHSR
jgi:hypothetical protein